MASREQQKYVSAEDVFAEDGPLTLADVILATRQCDELTQVQMSKRLGISAQNLCDIEKGRVIVSVKRAAKWANELSLHPALAAQYALQGMIDNAKLPYIVRVTLREPKRRTRKAAKSA